MAEPGRPFTPERLAERARRPEFTVRVMPVAFSPKQFEEAFGIGHTKLYEEIKAGRLIARKLGKRTIILAQDAMQWAQALPPISAFAGVRCGSYDGRQGIVQP